MSIETKRFDTPDEAREFLKGTFEVVKLGGITIGRAAYEPGWKWSEHVGRRTGERYCEVEHVGLVLAGRAAVQMKDGEVRVLERGDLFWVRPGHDSWVVGDEPYVSIHFLGAETYAKA